MIRFESTREEPQINVVPLVDVVFFMIIFFLVMTSFTEVEREQDVLLPTNRNPGSLSREFDRNVVVNVLKDGTIRLFGREASADDVAARIRERRERAREPLKVMVRADRRTAYGNVALALAAVERAGVQRPYVMTRMVELEE